jgi:hypothetical protein
MYNYNGSPFLSFLRPSLPFLVVMSGASDRLMARDHSEEADARARMNSQMPLEQKRARASCVLDNSGTREEAQQQVRRILAELRTLGSSWRYRLLSRSTIIVALMLATTLSWYLRRYES